MVDITLAALCLGYALYNAIRKTLPIVVPFLIHNLGLSKSEVGMIASNFAISYGFSKFAGSVISDFINCKQLFIFGLLCTSLTSLVFPFVGPSVSLLSGIWFVNGLVQGVGWPALSKIIYLTYSSDRRATVWSTASTAGNMGLILGSIVYPALLPLGWQAPFVFSGVLGIIISLACFIFVDDIYDKDIAKVDKSNSDNDAVKGKVSWGWIFSVPLASLFMSTVCTFFMQKSVSDWAGLFFIEKYSWNTVTANSVVFFNEVGSVVGSLASGYVADTSIFNHRKDVTCLVFSLLLLPTYLAIMFCLGSLKTNDNSSSDASSHVDGGGEKHIFSSEFFILAGCMFLVGIGCSGPKALTGLMVRNVVPVQYFGLAGGLFGVVGQLGGAAAGTGLGTFIQLYSWDVFFPTLLVVSSICSGLIFLFSWGGGNYSTEAKEGINKSSKINKNK